MLDGENPIVAGTGLKQVAIVLAGHCGRAADGLYLTDLTT